MERLLLLDLASLRVLVATDNLHECHEMDRSEEGGRLPLFADRVGRRRVGQKKANSFDEDSS